MVPALEDGGKGWLSLSLPEETDFRREHMAPVSPVRDS